METTDTYSPSNRYWWLILIIGILSVICGIWVFKNPVESYFALAIYFSIMFILYGISEIINAFANRRYRYWGWGLTVGILDFVIGFLLLGNLEWSADILPYVVGFILMFVGINFIGQSTQMQSLRIRNWGWVLICGILTLIFAFLIIFHPLFGIFNIIVWTGLAFIFGGVSAIFYSFAMRK
ncbi:MAG: HdeD family acid-resistance protein [Odoribacter sp.]